VLVATGPATAGATTVALQRFHEAPAVELKAGGPGHVLSGKVVDLAGVPVPGALAGATSPLPDENMAMYVVPADARGSYRIALPAGRYSPRATSPDGLPSPRPYTTIDRDTHVDLVVAKRDQLAAPAPDVVLAWLKKAAVPIATTEPDHDISDLEELAPMIGKARLVALGEATHGTREFSQMKHRMLEYLVQRQGVTAFLIEGGFGDVRALDAYVKGAPGDVKTAVTSLYGVWQTEEMAALVDWLRAWNADPAHAKVSVYGIDVQTPLSSLSALLAYLGVVDPDAQTHAKTALGPITTAAWFEDYRAIPEADRKGVHAEIAALLARFDAQRAAWTKATSARDWLVARKLCDLLRQNQEMREPLPNLTNYEEREKGMFENAMWVLDQAEPHARVAFWPHNGHIARDGYDGVASVGHRLATRLGRDYVTLGFVWNQGGFAAFPQGAATGVSHEVGPDASGGLGATFAAVGLPIAAFDLRTAPAGVVKRWLGAPHRTRDIGASFTTEANMDGVFELSASYDAVIFVDHTSAARRLQR
jgi:erythromycin esterase